MGSSPAPVLRAVFEGYEACEKLNEADPEDYPIWGYASWNQFRDPLAAFVGCNRDEIALLRNATEANSYIANGVDLKPGDEVLMTDQEHPGGEHPWDLRAKRYGIVVKKITLPRPVENPAQVLNLVQRRHNPAHASFVLQPHHHVLRSGAARQRTLCSGPHQRDYFRRRWSARPGNDAPEPARSGLRHVFLEPAQMAASAQRLGLSLRPRRNDRPHVEHDSHRRLGRREDPRRTIPAHRQFKRPRPLGIARLDSTGQRHRNGPHRTPPPPALRLHPSGHDQTRSDVVDVSGCRRCAARSQR